MRAQVDVFPRTLTHGSSSHNPDSYYVGFALLDAAKNVLAQTWFGNRSTPLALLSFRQPHASMQHVTHTFPSDVAEGAQYVAIVMGGAGPEAQDRNDGPRFTQEGATTTNYA